MVRRCFDPGDQSKEGKKTIRMVRTSIPMDSSGFKMMQFSKDITTKEQSQCEQVAGFKGQIPAGHMQAASHWLHSSRQVRSRQSQGFAANSNTSLPGNAFACEKSVFVLAAAQSHDLELHEPSPGADGCPCIRLSCHMLIYSGMFCC